IYLPAAGPGTRHGWKFASINYRQVSDGHVAETRSTTPYPNTPLWIIRYVRLGSKAAIDYPILSRPTPHNPCSNQHLPRKVTTDNYRNRIRKRLRKLVHPDQRIGDHEQHGAEPQQPGLVLDPASHKRHDIEAQQVDGDGQLVRASGRNQPYGQQQAIEGDGQHAPAQPGVALGQQGEAGSEGQLVNQKGTQRLDKQAVPVAVVEEEIARRR